MVSKEKNILNYSNWIKKLIGYLFTQYQSDLRLEDTAFLLLTLIGIPIYSNERNQSIILNVYKRLNNCYIPGGLER